MLTTAGLFLPLAGAVAAPLLTRAFKANAAWPLSLFLFLPFLIFASHIPGVSGGLVGKGGFAWAPSFGLDFAWRLDGLSLTFALLISGIGTLIVLYSGSYLKGHRHQGRFFSFILMFSAAMLGLVLCDNLHLLGADLDHLLPADRLRSRTSGVPPGGIPGFAGHRRGRAPVACGAPAAWPDGRCQRSLRSACRWRGDP
jgi:hypothetical protein